MGNQPDTSCFASKLYERKFNSDVIHKSKKQRHFIVQKNEANPERSRSSLKSQSLIESHNVKKSSHLAKNSKTITIEITINLEKNQQVSFGRSSTKQPSHASIKNKLSSSVESFDELRQDYSSYHKGKSTKSNTFAIPSKNRIISEALSKSSKAEEFDKLSLPSESNFSDAY